MHTPGDTPPPTNVPPDAGATHAHAPGGVAPDRAAPVPEPVRDDVPLAITPTPLPGADTGRRCENCGTLLLGEHCYRCGQPVRGMVRHFSTIAGDVIDTVFNWDSRTVRTLGPLLFRPGRLTQEYFEGHRVRFVSPVRLFFFFCVAAFLALQFSVDTDGNFGGMGRAGDISSATTVQQVEERRDAALKGMEAARATIPEAPGSHDGMNAGMDAIRAEADERIEYLKARDAAVAAGQPPPPDLQNDADADGEADGVTFRFNDRDWDADSNPLTIAWLPDFANARLNSLIGRARNNIDHVQDDPARLVEAFLQTLPQTLFVLLPVFALLLKIMYVFKRRLYMEHLIVALHSHAFLCAALLAMVLLTDIGAQFATDGWVQGLTEWLVFLLMLWMPLYLLLMQKRVYRQGWIMTLLKYFVLGNCYVILISLGVMVNLAFSVLAM